jgi:hypothetical protein
LCKLSSSFLSSFGRSEDVHLELQTTKESAVADLPPFRIGLRWNLRCAGLLIAFMLLSVVSVIHLESQIKPVRVLYIRFCRVGMLSIAKKWKQWWLCAGVVLVECD